VSDVLARRLEALGLGRLAGVELTDNRSVMVSLTPRRVLRIHRAYAQAPDGVLRAVVRFLASGVRRQARLAAQREILAFGVPQAAEPPARARDAAQPGDLLTTERLARLFAELNARHFDGALPDVPIRLSGRMRTRLGQLCLDPGNRQPTEITISRRHIHRHGWAEAEQTLLHEMVHLWQHGRGLPVDHGPMFRSMARAVGVAPSARRSLRTPLSRDRAARFA